jgi:ribonuclease VapC
MFIETSAIVSLIALEAGYERLVTQIEASSGTTTSPIVILEASMVLAIKLDVEPGQAEQRVRSLLDECGTRITSVDSETASLAVEAFSRYGKGRGHPARLNLADCFSYACAKQHKVPILYVGNDFAQTDIG